MAALTAGTRVRVVDRRRPVAGCTGEVIGWRGDAFQVELDGQGTHFFEPEELERVRHCARARPAATRREPACLRYPVVAGALVSIARAPAIG